MNIERLCACIRGLLQCPCPPLSLLITLLTQQVYLYWPTLDSLAYNGRNRHYGQYAWDLDRWLTSFSFRSIFLLSAVA